MYDEIKALLAICWCLNPSTFKLSQTAQVGVSPSRALWLVWKWGLHTPEFGCFHGDHYNEALVKCWVYDQNPKIIILLKNMMINHWNLGYRGVSDKSRNTFAKMVFRPFNDADNDGSRSSNFHCFLQGSNRSEQWVSVEDGTMATHFDIFTMQQSQLWNSSAHINIVNIRVWQPPRDSGNLM